MMKTGVIAYAAAFALFLFGSSVTAEGQSVAVMRGRLAGPAADGANVTIREHDSARHVVGACDNAARDGKVQGYRVRIYFGNGQNARQEAMETQSRFRTEFPGVPTYLVYENPSFMVTVGNCVTMDEALMLWNRVRHSFATAFLWRGEIPLADLLAQENAPVPAEEGTDPGASGEEEEKELAYSHFS